MYKKHCIYTIYIYYIYFTIQDAIDNFILFISHLYTNITIISINIL